jgi:hypothetical protein
MKARNLRPVLRLTREDVQEEVVVLDGHQAPHDPDGDLIVRHAIDLAEEGALCSPDRSGSG